MPLWLRRVLWGVAALLIVLVAAALWLVTTFDANRYKGVAIDWVKTHRNRTLTIDGPIELSVFPRLAVRLSQLRVSEVGKPDEFAALDDAGLAVDLLPLLRGELVVGRVQAKGVRVAYFRDAKGRSNVDDLLHPAAPTEPATRRPLRFDISSVDLADVRARVKDDANGVNGEILLKSLRSGRLADKVESPVKLVLLVDLKAPAVKGELSGDTRLLLDLDTSSLSLRDMSLGFKGDLPSASAIDAVLNGSLAWDGAKSAIDAQNLNARVSATLGGIKLTDSTLVIDRFAFDAPHKLLSLRKLKARVNGSQVGHPLSLDLDWPELTVSGDKLAASAFSGAVSRGGDMPFEAHFKSGAPSGNFDALRLPNIEAQITSRATQRKLDGTLHADLTLKPGQRALSWVVSGQLDTNTFATDGAMTLSGGTPHIAAKARFDALDLNRLLPPASGAAAKPAAPAADTPVDLAGLRSMNGQFSVQAGSFAYQQYRVNDARFAATLDAGVLRVTELKGKAWGGQVDMSAVADARASRVTVKGSAAGVNVNALIKDVAAKDWIEGTGRVTLDVDTAGHSVNEMKSHLKGSASLQVRDGAIKGINLAKAMRETRAAISMRQDAAQKASQTEKTDFSELSATFQINDGVARNKDLDLKSPFLRLAGEGAIDVGRGRIDYVTRATLASTAKGQGGAELAALKGLTVPVRLAGPFESLDWKIEWSAVVADAVASQLKDKLGQQLGLKPAAGAASSASPQDALRNKLKGLFK